MRITHGLYFYQIDRPLKNVLKAFEHGKIAGGMFGRSQRVEFDEIKIDAEGRWFHNGEPFLNERIITFFSKSIDVTRDGKYVIHYGNFVYPLIVEDAPLFVIGVKIEGEGSDEKVLIYLTSGESTVLDIKTLHYKNECLYCYVRDGKILAKFKRSPSFELLLRLEETDDIYYINIGGERIVLTEKM